MILAGDIGGTKTVLSLQEKAIDGTLTCVLEQTFASHDFSQFDDMLEQFLPIGIKVTSACIGIAGPVVNQCCQMTNLSWFLDATQIKKKLGTDQVKLLNDLEAMAIGMLHLPEQDLIELNPNATTQTGNIAVIAAGTGLGEAILYWDGSKYHPMATEGGHCDFAPQDTQQDKLLTYLRKLYPDHVSCERILSGHGFSLLYDFLCDHRFAAPCPDVPDIKSDVDRNAVISQLGVTGADPLCAEAVRLFTVLYGVETGNLALKSLALGGVFIGGGIAPKILPAMRAAGFFKRFTLKAVIYLCLIKFQSNCH